MTNLCFSICIPTNGRIDIVKNSLDSIYTDCKVPFSEFEVVLSDNSTNDELLYLLESYKQYPNIVYEKTDCNGFLNSINALKLGKGAFLKLQNNYTMFTGEGLIHFANFVKQKSEEKPLVFFKNSGKEGIKNYNSFDDFNCDLSFWNSWSTGFSIWKKDFDRIKNVEVNSMFPHTSLFLLQYSKKSFVLNDSIYFVNQEVPRKGGYDLFKTFAIDYLRMLEDEMLKGNLSKRTFNKIKKDLFFDFLTVWYSNTKILKNEYTFKLVNIKQSIGVYYSRSSYYKLIFYGHVVAFKCKIYSIINLIKNKKHKCLRIR